MNFYIFALLLLCIHYHRLLQLVEDLRARIDNSEGKGTGKGSRSRDDKDDEIAELREMIQDFEVEKEDNLAEIDSLNSVSNSL